MKIKFDSNQDFQLEAIRSVVDVFTGQPLARMSLDWTKGTTNWLKIPEVQRNKIKPPNHIHYP